MCVPCVLPAAFPPLPATSDPPPSAAVVSSAVPPLTGTSGLHPAACLLPCPTHANAQTKAQQTTGTAQPTCTQTGGDTKRYT